MAIGRGFPGGIIKEATPMGLPGIGGGGGGADALNPLKKIGKLLKSLPDPLGLLNQGGEEAKGGE